MIDQTFLVSDYDLPRLSCFIIDQDDGSPIDPFEKIEDILQYLFQHFIDIQGLTQNVGDLIDQLHILFRGHGPVFLGLTHLFAEFLGKFQGIQKSKYIFSAPFSHAEHAHADGDGKPLLYLQFFARFYGFPVNKGPVFAIQILEKKFTVSRGYFQVRARDKSILHLNVVFVGPTNRGGFVFEFKRLSLVGPL